MISRYVGRHKAIIVVWVHQPAKLELLQIILAGNRLCLGLGPAQRRQQQRRQNDDDGDDDEQFDERKGGVWTRGHARRILV